MIGHYDFLSPSQIIFGWGKRKELGTLLQGIGKRLFIITGSRTLAEKGVYTDLVESVSIVGIEAIILGEIDQEPEVKDVDHFVEQILEYDPNSDDMVLGIGGGSAMDLAKAVAAMAANRHGNSVQDFLEGVGKGLQVEQKPLSFIAMPTTSGTGSEVTKNAVISNYDPPFKKSLRDPSMIARLVVIDPQLTTLCPPEITAYSGMDTITQLIESYISKNAKPIPRALCLQGLSCSLPYITDAVENPEFREARENMSHAAMLSGLALANSGLGMAHGVAAALGVHHKIPHGLACALMLPVALKVNADEKTEEIAYLGKLFTSDVSMSDDEAVEAAIGIVEGLNDSFGIPATLSELGIEQKDLPALVKSSRGNSMNGNPVKLSDEELQSLLEEIL